MSEEILVLDLDRDDHVAAPPPDRPRLRDARVPLWGAALVTVAAVVTAVAGTRVWVTEHAVRAQESTASVLVSVAPDADLTGYATADGSRYRSTVQVLNIGPLPITVDGIVTTDGGLTLTASTVDAVVPPGITEKVEVELFQDCPQWRRTEPNVPLELRLDVTTADGVQRSQVKYLATRDTAWRDALEATCES